MPGPNDARSGGLEGYAEAFKERMASREWAEVLKNAQISPHEQVMLDKQQREDIIRGANMWKGDNMQLKQDSAGCRIITINVAKKLMTDVDSTEKGGNVTYLDYLIEYMQNMQCDIMICHEPGDIHTTKHLIERKAQAAQMKALIDCSKHTKACGVVILISSAWRKIEVTSCSHHTNDKEEKRVYYTHFKAKERKRVQDINTGKWKDLPLERMLVVSTYY